jgi:CheY-like chemotaxis protein
MECCMKTILLLEDEPSLLNLVSRVLARRGYSVLKAAVPEEAILKFIDSGRRIDLLITDLTLPGVSGAHLALLLREEVPDLAVTLTSGYPADSWKDGDAGYLRRLGPDSVRILLKPFATEPLLNMVDGLIGVPPRATASAALRSASPP